MALQPKGFTQVYRMEPHPPLNPSFQEDEISMEVYNRILRLQVMYQKAVADAESAMLENTLKLFDELHIK